MIRRILKKALGLARTKQDAELDFWREAIDRYQKWFDGELPSLYRTPSPGNDKKEKAPNKKDASILTWHRLHQEVKYLEDLDLTPDALRGMKLLDIGSGPMPSATCFEECQVYCLAPLLSKYLEVGFPLHYYENVTFIHGASERIPVQDGFFDAVISVNAIDHVDDMRQTAAEIKRILRGDGLFRMHVHYHPPTKCEPIHLDDALFQELLGWCTNLARIKTSKTSHSTTLPDDESFVLWSNF
ncbi:class I SAM-dependent methyltransferase [Candidatus Hydrogenedentota bacterium]